ncbi:hypothetical protein V8F20_008008 [Naviculisporaceae sp. PSN 640]
MASSQPEDVPEDAATPRMAEFYLTSVWQYHPDSAKRVINEMNLNYPDAQIIYDTEFHWFKISCRAEDQRRFTELFSYATADVEDDAFDKDHTNVLDEKGRLKLKFENDVIVYENDFDAFEFDFLVNTLDDYVFPVKLASFPYKEVWNRLEEEHTTIRHIVSQEDFEQLQADTGVKMEYDAPGKLVYMASMDAKCIDRAKAKLMVLWEYSQLPPSRTEHLLYSEGYVETGERAFDQFHADMRYMANVHPMLPAATLLDPACITNLERAYQKMYEQGATIRLCRWDDSKGHHFSMFGPDIKGRAVPRYRLGNRPSIFLATDASSSNANPNLPMTIPHTQSAVKDEKEARVAKWMEDWPAQSTMSVPEDETQSSTTDEYHTATATAYPGSTIDDKIMDDICSIAGGSGSREGKKEQLMTLVTELVKNAENGSSSASRTPLQGRMSDVNLGESATGSQVELGTPSPSARVISDMAWDQPLPLGNTTLNNAIMRDRPVPVEKPGAPVRSRETSPEAPKAAHPLIPVEPKPRTSPSTTITWEMAPLIPERVHLSTNPVPLANPITIGNEENNRDFKRYNEPGAGTFNTMDQQAPSRRTPGSATPSEYTRGTKLNIPKSAQPAARSFPTLSSPSNNFPTEINEAMQRLLLASPYRRGKVSVRADFGRVILGGMDQSCLAFNNRTTPSNGWKKEELLKHLNNFALQRDNIHFTKILSTYGYDLEQMINTRDLRGNRLWHSTPCRSWVVYSFRSVYINGDKEIPILIKCIFGDEGKSYTYEITPFNSGKDGVTPLYVHDILRNWDLRITMRSFESQILEQHLGSAVRRFLDTVRVSWVHSLQLFDLCTRLTNCHLRNLDVDDTELNYTLPNPSSLIVQEVRVLTKWRYLNATMKSELEITEVEPLSTKLVSQDKKREYRSQTPSKRELKARAIKGIAARWYEASVISTTMERLFRENEALKLGDKTSWDLQTLQSYGGEDVFKSLYGPALQMLNQMDQVGGNDRNNMPESPEYEVRRGNEEIVVPGYEPTATTAANSSAAPRQVAGRRPTGGRAVPGSMPASAPSVSQQSQQPATPQTRGRIGTQNSSNPARARWEARMESMRRADKEFW